MDRSRIVPRDLEERLNEIPAIRLKESDRARFRRIGNDLDRLGHIDERSGELYMDAGVLRMVIDRERPNRGLGREVVNRLRSQSPVGSNIVDSPPGKRLKWEEFLLAAERDGRPEGVTFDELGISSSDTQEDVRRILKSKFPDTPEVVFSDSDLSKRYFGAAADLLGGRDPDTSHLGGRDPDTLDDVRPEVHYVDVDRFWRCLLEGMAWWAAVAVVFTIVGMVTGSIATGPGIIGVILTFLGAFFRYWATFVIVWAIGCVYWYLIKPFFHLPD